MKRRVILMVSCVVALGAPLKATPLREEDQTAKNLYYNDNSDNFIIRWGFQDMCDHVFDPYTEGYATNTASPDGVRVNPLDVNRGDIIFVRNIDLFMKEVHPSIQHPYMIITHGNSLETNHDYQRKYLDEEKIIAWFSIHPFKEAHEKFHALPLGILQRRGDYLKRVTVNAFLKRLRDEKPKTALLYLNFEIATHGDRRRVKELFENKPFVLTPTEERLPFLDYLKEMAGAKFTLSPRGFGPDCYRTWEALLVGTIPIVRRCVYEEAEVYDKDPACEHSLLDDLYQGLPVVIIDAWEEVTQEFLEAKYQEISSKRYDIAPLYLEYWHRKIREVRDDYLRTNA